MSTFPMPAGHRRLVRASRAFVAAAERAAGTRIKVMAANRTLLRLAGTVNSLMRETADMYYLFTDPVVLDDSALRAVLPEVRKTPYKAGIAATMIALRDRSRRAYV